MTTQRDWLRAQLIAGHAVTPLDALRGCGCFRLAARIDELRQQGLPIRTTIVRRNTKRFAEYRLVA